MTRNAITQLGWTVLRRPSYSSGLAPSVFLSFRTPERRCPRKEVLNRMMWSAPSEPSCMGRTRNGTGGTYRGADKSLARPGRKRATATEDFDVHISYLLS